MFRKLLIFDFYQTLYNPKTGKLFTGTRKLLKKISSNNDLILISTGGSKRKRLINKLKITEFFKRTIICQEKTLRIFRNILVDYQVQTSQVVIIGDRKEEEIRIGKILGTKTIQVNPEKENPIKQLISLIIENES